MNHIVRFVAFLISLKIDTKPRYLELQTMRYILEFWRLSFCISVELYIWFSLLTFCGDVCPFCRPLLAFLGRNEVIPGWNKCLTICPIWTQNGNTIWALLQATISTECLCHFILCTDRIWNWLLSTEFLPGLLSFWINFAIKELQLRVFALLNCSTSTLLPISKSRSKR